MIAGIVTIILLVAFLGGVAWAYSAKRKPEFDAAARLPLEDRNEDKP
jgi:cytochrome c oxidase cbb3-type subunit IV